MDYTNNVNKNKLNSLQNLLSLSVVTLIVTVWATVSFLAYQNKLLSIYSSQNLNKNEKLAIQTDQFTNWQTYNDDSFSFRLPQRWQTRDYILENSQPIKYPEKFEEKQPYKKVIDIYEPDYFKHNGKASAVIFIYDNHNKLGLEEYEKELLKEFSQLKITLYKSYGDTVKIGNAYSLPFYNVECLLDFCDVYNINTNGKIYSIQVSYEYVSKEIFNQILSTFIFTNETTTTPSITPLFVCPPNGWVDCMPTVSEEKSKLCSEEAQNWYKVNCPNYQGVAY